HRSQWVQMADLTAWSAYQGLLRHEGKQFAWTWYDDISAQVTSTVVRWGYDRDVKSQTCRSTCVGQARPVMQRRAIT
ncbi:MAG TPA: hypothetical protein VFX16_00355, partial [Pseudonocardiaceae bacterium]|nr:hypothetical protein [Pseudonocardiaceae bacterium]